MAQRIVANWATCLICGFTLEHFEGQAGMTSCRCDPPIFWIDGGLSGMSKRVGDPDLWEEASVWVQDTELLALEFHRQQMHPRPASVATLDELIGPDHGEVELPLHLDWGTPTTYDLANRRRAISMYKIVLTYAPRADDLRTLLNDQLLKDLWPELRNQLSRTIAGIWENTHTELRGE